MSAPRLGQYIVVLSAGPLIMVRIPMKGKPGYRRRAISAAAQSRALTQVMRVHGLKQKDISGLDGHLHPDDWDPLAENFWRKEKSRVEADARRAELEKAFCGEGNAAREFWLYDWSGEGFVLVREPVSGEDPQRK